jgi:hypothetical protein
MTAASLVKKDRKNLPKNQASAPTVQLETIIRTQSPEDLLDPLFLSCTGTL